MIHEEICTYEVCKLAKEKGFPIECNMFYNRNGELCDDRNYDSFDNEIQCYAPTQSLLQRWLREEKGIIVEVLSQPSCDNEQKICYWWALRMNSNGLEFDVDIQDSKTFNEYEEALEDAELYALKNLL